MAEMSHILNLVREYFLLEDGFLISLHDERLKLFDITDPLEPHPHANARVYITRRSLKHVVESRRKDLLKKHTHEEALSKILFAVQAVQETILKFDHYELEPGNKHFYSKDFSQNGMPKIRILLAMEEGNLLVTSIHFARRTKKHRD